MTKYIIYYEDSNEMGEVAYESLQEVLHEVRKDITRWLIRQQKFRDDPAAARPWHEVTPTEEAAFESPCEICDRRIHCLVQDPCEHSPIIWEFPDEVTVNIIPQMFFGLSIIQEFLDQIEGVRSCRVNLVGRGSFVY